MLFREFSVLYQEEVSVRLFANIKWTRRKWIAIVSVILLCCILAACGVFSDIIRGSSFLWRAAHGSPAVITLSGNPAESGRIHGRKLKFGIQLLEKYYLGSLAAGQGRELLFQRADNLFQNIDPRWNTEITALAEAACVDPRAMKFGNCFLDLGRFPVGCRQILRVLPDGRTFHAHNLDWDGLAGIGQHWITVFRVPGGEGRLPTVYLGFSGMIGALDVINSAGVALSFNQLGSSRQESEMPVFLRMREIAETSSDFDGAEEAILSMPPGMPFAIGLSDAKSGRIAVYERDSSGVVRKRVPVDGLLTADNSPQSQKNAPPDTGTEHAARDALPLDSPEAVQAVLRDSRVLMANNMYSVIFDFQANCFYLASGEIPAAAGEYRVYPLFE